MKKLNLDQMEKIQGGSFWWALGCLAAGIVAGAVATPAAGIAVDTVCEVLNPESAS